MLSVFRGWRRKLGLICLLFGLAISCAWFSSYRHAFSSESGKSLLQQTQWRLVSSQGCIMWIQVHSKGMVGISSGVVLIARGDGRFVARMDDGIHYWSKRGWGAYHSAELDAESGTQLTRLVIPYWSVALPWALAAAYLLCGGIPEDQRRSYPKSGTDPGS